VINLARRTDRWASISRQLDDLGLSYQRLEAVDAETVSDDVLARYWPPHVKIRDTVTRGAKCCFISHRKSWEALLESDESWAAVLEDDARLHPDAALLLSDDRWLPESAALVKIEVNYLRQSRRILIGKSSSVGHDYAVAALLSKHMGTGGYLVSRRGAELLLAATLEPVSDIDGILFNPNISPVFAKLRPMQLCPAVVAQSTETGLSDLLKWRNEARAQKKRGLGRRLRGLQRSFEEIRNIPKAAIQLGLRRAQFVEIGFGRSDASDPAESEPGSPESWAVRSPFQ